MIAESGVYSLRSVKLIMKLDDERLRKLGG